MANAIHQGDPDGRRIARRKSALLAEASRVGRLLFCLLERANFDSGKCSELIKDIGRQEQIELQRANGRIEQRRRFKNHSSQPLLDYRPVDVLYLDECGKSSPEPMLPAPRIFSLGAISIHKENVDNYIAEANRIKIEFLGRDDITFHEPDMREGNGRWGFNGDKVKQSAFDRALDELVRNTGFVVFGAAIRKDSFSDFVDSGVDKYLPTDVYAAAVVMLLERYLDYLGVTLEPKRLGRLEFESIGPKEDAYHQYEYAKLLLDGTQWVPDSTFRNFLQTGCIFRPKKGSNPLELADMFARDLFEWVRDGCLGSPKRWHLFSDKIYCRGDGMMGKFGMKVFPDSDIRDLIEAHRVRYGAVGGEK